MRTSWALAALLALSGAAEAGTKTEIISLDGRCDVLTLKIGKAAVTGFDDPGCEAGFGAGYIGKVKGFGNAVVAGVQFAAQPGKQFVLRIAYPLVTGGAWDLAVTADGRKLTPFSAGTYTLEGTADKGPRGAAPAAR
ncbi:MAG TPA: hypothetical protein VG889_10555 [Rhizomicrobium sp.]|nr:hypothetical protein [Rhizomicrobium sp.]